MRRVCFDKGTYSLLWRSEALAERSLQRLRRRLSSELFARRPALVIGPLLISEMAALNVDRRNEEVAFLTGLPDVKYLRPSAQIVEEEIRAVQEGRPPDVFLVDRDARNILSAGLREPALWKAEVTRLEADKNAFATMEQGARDAIVKRYPSRSQVTKQTEEWFKDPEATVRSWAMHLLRKHRMKLALPADEAKWPDVRALPTVWAHASYQVARIYLVNRDRRRIDTNDYPDWRHFVAAAYADDFVVNDRRFTEIIARCPPPKPTVLTFETWAQDALA